MEFSWRQWELVVLVCAVYLTWGLTDSIQVDHLALRVAVDAPGVNHPVHCAVGAEQQLLPRLATRVEGP